MPKITTQDVTVSPFSSVVYTFDPRTAATTSTLGASLAVGTRVVMPKSGTLQHMSIFIATASGSADVGVYSIDSTTTRSRLWSSGSNTVSATGWQNFGSPGIAVYRGQVLDFAVAVADATISMGRTVLPNAALGSFSASVESLAETHTYAKATSFPLPSSFSSVIAAAGTTYCPLIAARIG